MLLDAPYGGAERIDRETGDYCAVRLAVVSLPGGEGVPSLRPAVEKALKSRGGPGYLIRAEGAQATLLLCDFGEEDVSWLEGLPQELAAAVPVSPWRWGWDGGAARSGRFISPTGRRAWRCGGPTWRMGMPSVSTTT